MKKNKQHYAIRVENVKKEIKALIAAGIYCQHELFNRLYPTFDGHYFTLRTLISEEKNGKR